MSRLEKDKQPLIEGSEFNIKGSISELDFANQKSRQVVEKAARIKQLADSSDQKLLEQKEKYEKMVLVALNYKVDPTRV